MISILDVLYPPRCPICDGVRLSDEPVCCPGCLSKISFISEPYCLCCGRPLSADEREFCYDCQKRTRSYAGGVSLAVYEGLWRESIVRFKYHSREEYASWYAEQLILRFSDRLRNLHADTVLAVPMHERKVRKRGYNQAESLAKELAVRMGVPFCKGVLQRTRYTAPQKELSDVARLQNLTMAFAVDEEKLTAYKKDHAFERVILVDDIYTTGSTMEACARLLIKAGAKAVAPVTAAIAGGFVS